MTKITVGDIRKAIEGLPDETTVDIAHQRTDQFVIDAVGVRGAPGFTTKGFLAIDIRICGDQEVECDECGEGFNEGDLCSCGCCYGCCECEEDDEEED